MRTVFPTPAAKPSRIVNCPCRARSSSACSRRSSSSAVRVGWIKVTSQGKVSTFLPRHRERPKSRNRRDNSPQRHRDRELEKGRGLAHAIPSSHFLFVSCRTPCLRVSVVNSCRNLAFSSFRVFVQKCRNPSARKRNGELKPCALRRR